MGARIVLRRAMVVAVVVLCSIAGLSSVAHAATRATTPITPGTPVHVVLAADATESFTIPVKAHQTLALISTHATAAVEYQLLGPDGTSYENRDLSAPNNTAFDWSDLLAGTYTLQFTGKATKTEFDVDVRVLTDATTDLQPGSTTTQKFTVPWQNVVRRVYAKAGQHIGLLLGAPSIGASVDTGTGQTRIDVRIAAPGTGPYQGTGLHEITQGDAPAFDELPGTVPVTGTYTILFDPLKDTTGSVSIKAVVTSDVVRTATLGKKQTMDTATPGQNQVIRFKGAVGYRPVLRVTKVALDSVTYPGAEPLEDYATYGLRAPDGTLLEQLHQEDQLRTTYLTFAKAGVWSVVIDPVGDYVGHVEYTLTLVKDLVYTPEAGVKTKVSITSPGQNAVIAMHLKAGQRLVFRTGAAHWTVTPPDLLIVGPKLETYPFDEVKGYLETAPVAHTGQYLLAMDPYDVSTGYETVAWSAGKNVVRAVTLGVGTTVPSTTPGENTRLTFTGTTGKRFSVKVYAQSWTAGSTSAPTAHVRLLDPAGKVTWSALAPAAGGTLTGPQLTSNGKWSLVVDPDHDAVGSVRVRLSLT